MTPARRNTPGLWYLAALVLVFSGCSPDLHKLPISDLSQKFYHNPNHLGDAFVYFQNGFQFILTFILLFTAFQYWQNRRQDYLSYIFYLMVAWLYFARVFPLYFYPIFTDTDSYLVFHNYLRGHYGGGFNDQTEFIFFCFLTVAYVLFLKTFFSFRDQLPDINKIIERLVLVLLVLVSALIIAVSIDHKCYISGLPEVLLKQVFTLPSFWLLWRLGKATLPGAGYIITGSMLLLLGSYIVGYLHITGDLLSGKRVFLQIGVLMEVLFFSAALGRKDYLLRLQLDLANQSYENFANEKLQAQKEKRRDILKLNREKQKLRSLSEKIRELQQKLEKYHNGFKPIPQKETFSEKLERVMAQHYTDPDFHVELLAKTLNLTPATLYRRIKKLHQISIEIYLRNYRIERSKELFANPDLSLKEIAARVGFDRYDHFSSAFKKKELVPPRAFRHNMLHAD